MANKEPTTQQVEVITLNCQGLRTTDHRDTLFSWLNCTNVDFLCLQETHSTSRDEFASWLQTAKEDGLLTNTYSCLSSPGTNRSSGVAIIYNHRYALSSCHTDQQGRLIRAQFTLANNLFQICNVYAPNSSVDGAQFFESLYPVIDSAVPCILCGDFNTVVDPIQDRRGCNPWSKWAYNWSGTLTNLMSTFDLRDVWRLHHPTTTAFTWNRANLAQASRLDMFWISTFFLPFVLSVDIFPFFRSDHSYVYLKLSLPSTIHRGPGVWKFNVTHLKDPAFVLLVEEFWRFWKTEKPFFFSLSAWWDAGKARLRRKIRTFSSKKAATTRKRLSSLQHTLFHLNRRANLGEDVTPLLNDTKAALEAIHRERARGCRIRANVQWAEEGEASTKYFFNLEKSRGQSRLFSAIRTVNGLIVTSFLLILRAWVAFYVSLYTADTLQVKKQDFFLSQIDKKLSPAQRELCEGELTLEECKLALDAMATGKSPGLDGFPAEFYQCFWALIGQDYVEVVNSCYSVGSLTASQRGGLITLLYKKGDRLDMKNWRPITLLCVDYKIASKAIANRLLTVLPSIIHSNQSCGVKGRNPIVNNRLLQDIVDDLNHRGIGGAVLSLDQEKAFDRVDWSYLLRVLRCMNFGESFCQWISLFYTRITSCVLINGVQSDSFYVSRGVRQGCPLSPLLYVLMAETLACAIRSNSAIDGMRLPGNKCIKICQYADDTSLIVLSDSAMIAVFDIFRRYELASGAKLNVKKSHGLLVGPWRTRTNLPIPLDWSSMSISVMGFHLSNGGDTLSWQDPIEQFTSVLASWTPRQLSFHGRALVTNTLGLSIFWYLASFLSMPDSIVSRINSHAYSFIWNKKREWLARTTVTQRPSQGGLGLVDLKRKISALHVL